MSKYSLLIVDDFEEDQQELIQMIRKSGGDYLFETVFDGDSALSAFKSRRHDCIIVDYRLKHESGLELIARLKAVDPHCATIMMSGHGSEKVAAAAMKSGAVDYIVKGSMSGPDIRAAIQKTVMRCREERKASLRQQEQNQFLMTLVHDIKAPFSNISNSTAMLVEDLENGNTEDIEILIKAQSDAVRHAEALIKTLQTYALLDADVTFEKVNLDRVFETLNQMLQPEFRQRCAALDVDALPPVNGHAPQLIQLFQNLLSNALKFNTSDKPRVAVRLIGKGSDVVTICVEDNGLGIDEKDTVKIFQPLKRLWSKDEFDGTGLGLSICKKIIDRHRGRIWCDSVPGEGSKFFVQLQPVA